MAKLRKLFTNDEIIGVLQTNNNNLTRAAKELSTLRKVKVSKQLLKYWKDHLELKNKSGKPYVGTTILDREIREKIELRTVGQDDDCRLHKEHPHNERILIIPDQHAPYHHPDALEFLLHVAQAIDPTRVINLGDETDSHALSMHDSDPNLDSAGTELAQARIFLHKLAELFPIMDVCHSNHGSLIYRRAYKFGIPVEMIKSYRDILFPEGGGDGWQWKEKIKATLPNGESVLFQHQSAGDILANAAHERASIVQGHEHGKAEIKNKSSGSALYWAMTSGCLINPKALAFAYGKLFATKPIIGCSVIIDSQPLLITMPQNSDGRYTGKLNGVFTI